MDSSGNLYVADSLNNRVLFYPSGSTTATQVYGQLGSFTTNTADNGGISANSFNRPLGVTLDSSGNLYVGDVFNSRVLFYPSGSTTATRVYGQLGSFTTGTINKGGISANTLAFPTEAALDYLGNLYVPDTGNNRVLFYPSGNTTATQVWGQLGSFTTDTANNGGVSTNSLDNPEDIALDSLGNLYVADPGNNRVLAYPPQAFFDDLNFAKNVYQCGTANSTVLVSGTGSSWGKSYTQADEFVSQKTGRVTAIDVGVGYFNGTNSFFVELWTDSNGYPGTLIEHWNNLQGVVGCPALVSITGITGLSLTAGTNYFLVIGPTNLASTTYEGWNLNNQSPMAMGTVLNATNGCDNGGGTGCNWNSNGTQTLGAFAILP